MHTVDAARNSLDISPEIQAKAAELTSDLQAMHSQITELEVSRLQKRLDSKLNEPQSATGEVEYITKNQNLRRDSLENTTVI